MNDLRAIVSELAAFADDDEEVVVEDTGDFLVVRSGRDITGRFVTGDDGELRVRMDDEEMTYRRFLTHKLARLDVFAERIVSKRNPPPVFVDGLGQLHTAGDEPRIAPASELLQDEFRQGSPFATRVLFLTADAGFGKTVLLREFQHRQAQEFLSGRAQSLFWHVDLQGRQLVRLSEALMGDLGDLRVPGLWMPAIVRLIRRRAIVLAIDGFDELAAEQGSGDALGALATLVQQLDGEGVIVAASRRTFFDTEDYLARAGLMRRTLAAPCEFDQLSLLPWRAEEAVALFGAVDEGGRRLADPQAAYDETVSELGGDASHPMVTRPFLVSQLARALALYEIEPAVFVRGMDDPLKGVAALVQAFVDREVTQKWIHRETGEPYLTPDQHMELLSAVAEEMYRAQKDRLPLDVIETVAGLLLDQWSIPQDRRIQVMSMVKMHVLLTIPADGSAHSRAFDHSEFRDYFVAYALRRLLDDAASGLPVDSLAAVLRIAQLSDSTARYVCAMLDLGEGRAARLAEQLAALCRDETRTSYAAMNAGTLLPFVLDGRSDSDRAVRLDAPVIFSSLVLEGTSLASLEFVGATFLNVSLSGIDWRDVTLTRCLLGELTVDDDTSVMNVVLDHCELTGLRILQEDGEQTREFAPSRIRTALSRRGFIFADEAVMELPYEPEDDSPFTKLVRRVLRRFQRSTVLSEPSLQKPFRQDLNAVTEQVMPCLVAHGVAEERVWHGAGTQRVWALSVPLEDLLAAEEPSGSPGRYAAFWQDVKSR